MTAQQHTRPLWIGLTACTFFVPLLAAILQMFSMESVILGPLLVFVVGSIISGLATILAAAPVVLLLRHKGWLNSIVLCVIGTVVGAAAMGLFAFSDSQHPQMLDQSLANWITRQAVLKALVPGATFGFLSAAALCVGSGITIRSSRARFAASCKYH